MKTSSDFALRSETFTAEQLLDINTDFVKGVIYTVDLECKYVTPCRTFNGFCADCFVVKRTRQGWKIQTDCPVPVKLSDLGEPMKIILP